MRALLGVAAVGLLSVGCGRYFAPNRNLSDLVGHDAVVGEWRLTEGSLRLLVRDGFRPERSQRYVLRVREGGACDFASVLDDFEGATYVAAPCSWILEHDTSGDSNVWKRNALRISVMDKRTYLNFTQEDGRLILWNYYGDPDSWEFIEYERQRPDQPAVAPDGSGGRGERATGEPRG